MESSLWKQKNYLLGVPYIIATPIYEYDISKANINVLYAKGAIDKSYYDKLYVADRMTRQVEIGYLLRRDEDLNHILANGIIEYKQKLFEANNITDNRVLSIKNDAVFVMSIPLSITKFDNIEFVLKNTYSSYLKLGNDIEVYFLSNIANGTMSLDIKGISDANLQLHYPCMIEVIANCMLYIEAGNINDGLMYIGSVYNDYIGKRLDPGFYRTFDYRSKFIINTHNSIFQLDNCTDIRTFDALDISCNLNILRELYGTMTNIYFQRNR